MLKIYSRIKCKKLPLSKSFTNYAVQLFKLTLLALLCFFMCLVIFLFFFRNANANGNINSNINSNNLYSLTKFGKAQNNSSIKNSNCKKFEAAITQELKKYENTPFSSNLICALIFVESSFIENAISHYGAVGLMQVTLHALNDYNLFAKKKYPMLSYEMYEVGNNIKLGMWYLHHAYNNTKKYAGTQGVAAALSGYYWGITRAVNKRLVHTEYSNKVQNFALQFANTATSGVKIVQPVTQVAQ